MIPLGLSGCTKTDGGELGKKLDDIDKRLAKIEKSIDKVGTARPGAARPGKRGQRPPGPDPKAIYSVPIKGAPFKGAANAKVTVVEAFEFA